MNLHDLSELQNILAKVTYFEQSRRFQRESLVYTCPNRLLEYYASL